MKKTDFKTLNSIYKQLSKDIDPFDNHLQEHEWRVSRDFWEGNYTDSEMDEIEEEFASEYQELVSTLKEVWGNPSIEIKEKQPFWYQHVIEMSCWEKAEKANYICLHRGDRELPYTIALGVILKEAM
jgi:hypothetical protein